MDAKGQHALDLMRGERSRKGEQPGRQDDLKAVRQRDHSGRERLPKGANLQVCDAEPANMAGTTSIGKHEVRRLCEAIHFRWQWRRGPTCSHPEHRS